MLHALLKGLSITTAWYVYAYTCKITLEDMAMFAHAQSLQCHWYVTKAITQGFIQDFLVG